MGLTGFILQNVCDGRIDCSDGSDENGCPSGCGGQSWLEGDRGTVSVAKSELPKTCTWIYHGAEKEVGVIRFEKILTDAPFSRVLNRNKLEKTENRNATDISWGLFADSWPSVG